MKHETDVHLYVTKSCVSIWIYVFGPDWMGAASNQSLGLQVTYIIV